VVAAVQYLGNVNDIVGALKQVSPYYLSWVPPNITNNFFMGVSILIVSWTFAGFGVVGQPHIMIRFMALNHVDSMSRARCIYYVWYIIFSVLTIMAGLAARVILPNTNGFDAELALPMLSQMLLAPVFVGFILAGLFSATMSTADSQILSCAAAITQDLNWGKKNYVITKLGTIGVTLIALSIAIFGSDSVFGLVTIAWAALGCAFSPLIIVFICGGKPSQPICVGMIIFSLVSMMSWKLLVPNSNIYEILPGFIGGFFIYFVGYFFTKLRNL
jgi:Na+/proline symporter